MENLTLDEMLSIVHSIDFNGNNLFSIMKKVLLEKYMNGEISEDSK